jgi:hypothetical protein
MSGISLASPVADEFIEHFPKHIGKKRRGQPAGISIYLFTVETVDYADSKSDCSTMANPEHPFLGVAMVDNKTIAKGGSSSHESCQVKCLIPIIQKVAN